MNRTGSLWTAALIAAPLLACGGGGTTETGPKRVLPAGVTEAMVTEGTDIYRKSPCSTCHGPNGRSGAHGPDLSDDVWLHGGKEISNLIRIITQGMPADSFKSPSSRPDFAMFERGGVGMTDDRIRSVAAYIWTLSEPPVK